MKLKFLILLTIFSLALGVASAGATLTTQYVYVSGTEPSEGRPIQATAEFIFDSVADTIEVKLWNTQADPRSIAQCLSDLGFVLTTGQTSGSLTSSSGLSRTVAAGGTFTDGSSVSTGWLLRTNVSVISYLGNGLLLNDLNGGAGPKNLIIGPPNSSTGLYGNANPSITGSSHEPVLYGSDGSGINPAPVDFLLSVPGIDDTTRVYAAVFSFGTTSGDNVVPVPPTVWLLGGGLVGLVLLGRRRRG